MREYAQVFSEPQGLPPSREVDHIIPIKVGVDPVKVRPHRHPYLQKHEIEKQVVDMIKLGIIRPSNSPYSSLVILVKKER